MEKEIKLAARLYKCRDNAKFMFGDKYHEKIQWYMDKILEHQKRFNIETLPAVLEICSMEMVREDATLTTIFMAAAVEIMEPSNK